MQYQEKVDLLFEQEAFQHRNLRTLFDHQSAEWSQTGFNEKEELLMKLYLSEEPISYYVKGYEEFLLNTESPSQTELHTLAQSVRLLIMHVKDELIRASLLKIYVDLSKEKE